LGVSVVHDGTILSVSLGILGESKVLEVPSRGIKEVSERPPVSDHSRLFSWNLNTLVDNSLDSLQFLWRNTLVHLDLSRQFELVEAHSDDLILDGVALLARKNVLGSIPSLVNNVEALGDDIKELNLGNLFVDFVLCEA
jgi:hypothetical protein